MFLRKDVQKVFIILGKSCNMNCSYCLQSHSKVENVDINPDVLDFLCELGYENKEKRLRIVFFGGEPLLYFDKIVEIVTRLKSMCGVIFSFGIISNGKAITNDMVKFINDNSIGLTLSWDGSNTINTRGFDVLANSSMRERLLNIKNFSISGVVSPSNLPSRVLSDCQKVSNEYFLIHGNHLNVNLDTLMVFNDEKISEQDCKLLYNDMVEVIDSTISTMRKGIPGSEVSMGYLASVLSQSSNYVLADEIYARCGNGYSVLNVDLEGNLYSCHNESDKIGTIYDDYLGYLREVLKLDDTHEKLNFCKDCKVSSLCSMCKLIHIDEMKRRLCNIKLAMYSPIIEFVDEVNKVGVDVC